MVVSYDIPTYFRKLNAKQMLQVRDILNHAGYYLPLPQVGDQLFHDEMFLKVYQDDDVNKKLYLRTVKTKPCVLPDNATVEIAVTFLDDYAKYYTSRLTWAERVTLILHGTESQPPMKFDGFTYDVRSWLGEYFAETNGTSMINFSIDLISTYTEVLKIQDDNAFLYDDTVIQWKSENPYQLYPIQDIPDTTDRMIVRDLFNRLFFIEDTAFIVADDHYVKCDYHDVKTLEARQDTMFKLYSVSPVELVDGPMIDEIKELLIDAYFKKISRYKSTHNENYAVALADGNVIYSGSLYGASILESYSYELLKCTSPYKDLERYHLEVRVFGPNLLLELLE